MKAVFSFFANLVLPPNEFFKEERDDNAMDYEFSHKNEPSEQNIVHPTTSTNSKPAKSTHPSKSVSYCDKRTKRRRESIYNQEQIFQEEDSVAQQLDEFQQYAPKLVASSTLYNFSNPHIKDVLMVDEDEQVITPNINNNTTNNTITIFGDEPMKKQGNIDQQKDENASVKPFISPPQPLQSAPLRYEQFSETNRKVKIRSSNIEEDDWMSNMVLEDKFSKVLQLRQKAKDYEQIYHFDTSQQVDQYYETFLQDFSHQFVQEIFDQNAKEIIIDSLFDEITKEVLLETLKETKELLLFNHEDNELLDMIFAVVTERNRFEKLSEKFNMDITRDKMSCLSPTQWLNDEIINFYFKLLTERSQSPAYHSMQLPKCFCFNSHFYAKLFFEKQVYNYKAVQRWTKKDNIFTYDKILIPIHLSNHWTLCVINFRDQRMEYYDSLGGVRQGRVTIAKMKQYLKDEWEDKKAQPGFVDNAKYKFISADKWTEYIPSSKEIPQQTNGYDCGMFCCKFANCVSQDLKINFSQKHIDYFRERMALEIVSQKVI